MRIPQLKQVVYTTGKEHGDQSTLLISLSFILEWDVLALRHFLLFSSTFWMSGDVPGRQILPICHLPTKLVLFVPISTDLFLVLDIFRRVFKTEFQFFKVFLILKMKWCFCQ